MSVVIFDKSGSGYETKMVVAESRVDAAAGLERYTRPRRSAAEPAGHELRAQ
ncbi:hypothetical protein [Actinoallomurus iriomotensis]|uniref:hypothetical protein n=1 Tax=Actinoallomurus TaxID=667113 RepID=UPI002554836D|nr:hypothetical protein [Actinoallomurus iriomotensis]